MRILIACEFSGVVRDAFIALGHDAMSCDILAAPGPHHCGDVLDILDDGWDMMIAHPPCTYICSSGLHWNKNDIYRTVKTVNALEFVEALWAAPIARVAIENPVGCISTRLGLPKPQYVQPYWFGDDASKKTGLWTRGLSLLEPTKMVYGRTVVYRGRTYKRWANQDDGGYNNVPNNAQRGHIRSITYSGLAAAMASQWSSENL